MLRSLIKSLQDFARTLRDDAGFVIFACKATDRFDGIESHDGNELHLVPYSPAQELDIPKSGDLAVLDPEKYFLI